MIGIVAGVLSSAAKADTFTGAHYDPRTDELVVTMQYPGTNPDHGFTIQWDVCPALPRGQSTYDIAAEVLDSQWNDEARQTFTKTVRFSLRNLSCRPARITMHTAPRYYYIVTVPAAPTSRR
jgi:hypothetical protein